MKNIFAYGDYYGFLKKIMVLIILISSIQCHAKETDFEVAEKNYKEKDYKKASVLYIKACENGNGDACYRLSHMFLFGEGGSENRPKAKEYAQKACENKSGSGCYHLLKLLLSEGIRDGQKERTLLEKACNYGHTFACDRLGSIFFNGEDVPKDHVKAREFYRKACYVRPHIGCEELADMYANGLGGKKDLLKAKHFYGIACSLNGPSACNKIIDMFEYSEGKEKDLAEVRSFYEKLCEKDDAMGCFILAHMLRNGIGGKTDLPKGGDFYIKGERLQQTEEKNKASDTSPAPK